MAKSALLLAGFLAVSGAVVQAQNFPSLFDVEGVGTGDILYIRDKPSSKSSIIGAYEFDEKSIEVIREQDNWGLVNYEEGIGWASLDFLKPVELPSDYPAVCFGTEPFWSSGKKQYEGSPETWVTFEAMGEDELNLLMKSTDGSLSSGDTTALFAENTSEFLVALVRREICSDGMSDRVFGLSAEIVIGQGENLRHVSGCCSLKSPPASSD
ncbi:hypothetical protein [Lentibacter sp. XHP0401]|jgi:uncharacterized membrane protein|uniref:hypothetical protein n=1 Tax=Lentibacter sp. XHP0401 TaxID=2984334 RepID=UPI0021E8867A|nr:hypothetical protein [Lentibacter sp. XHP0401]MCV2892552.1 hypothetical protein [Lentibacter sp. XHP0401]